MANCKYGPELKIVLALVAGEGAINFNLAEGRWQVSSKRGVL